MCARCCSTHSCAYTVVCSLKNNINNTHKLTLLDVHYLTYQKTTSKACTRAHTYAGEQVSEREREKWKASKNEMNKGRWEEHSERAQQHTWKCSKTEVPTAKLCLTKRAPHTLFRHSQTITQQSRLCVCTELSFFCSDFVSFHRSLFLRFSVSCRRVKESKSSFKA